MQFNKKILIPFIYSNKLNKKLQIHAAEINSHGNISSGLAHNGRTISRCFLPESLPGRIIVLIL